MPPETAPYGTWISPLPADRLVDAVVRLGQLQVYRDDVYWVESRPEEGGREVIVRHRGGATTDVTPAGFYARSRVHEYGGRCYAVQGDDIVFSNWSDQRLWLTSGGSDPAPVTPEPDPPGSVRFADPVFDIDGTHLYCVRERHLSPSEIVNDLISIPLRTEAPPVVIAAGHDFYSAPRVSPDGRRICWITWDHPDMPWDSTQLWTADITSSGQLESPTLVAGGNGESVTQPRWSPGGVLLYVSDRSGWWNIHDEASRPLCRMESEFGRPDWVFGASTYGFGTDGELVAVWESDGVDHLGRIEGGRASETVTSFTYFAAIAIAGDDDVVALAASPSEAPTVVRIGGDGSTRHLRRSQEVSLDPGDISVPTHVSFPTGTGDRAFALVHLPANARYAAPPGERPPVLVFIHGGPTSSALAVFDRSVQFWTTRGFAVANVNYRGSTGYGRAFREKLKGNWGLADVEDCAAVVAWLDAQGLVDGTRALIRGGSAGGFTTLAALAFTDAFAAGASLYGVADLELLVRHTHKFESRYLYSLIGPWPQDAEEYRRRSPVHHLESFRRPVILFQGSEDAVVPPEQSRLMFDELTARGVDVEYVEFAGEQHGFRKAETIVEVATRELGFYQRVLGLSPPA